MKRLSNAVFPKPVALNIEYPKERKKEEKEGGEGRGRKEERERKREGDRERQKKEKEKEKEPFPGLSPKQQNLWWEKRVDGRQSERIRHIFIFIENAPSGSVISKVDLTVEGT